MLSFFKELNIKAKPIKRSKTDKASRRAELYNLLGDLPERDRPVKAFIISTETRETYRLEKLTLDLNGIEPVPAYFTKPRQNNNPSPVILYNHSHGGQYDIGKEELIKNRSGFQHPPYAEALARIGISSLCIDTWAFGERRGRSESAIFKQMLWEGRVMWGMMVYDSLKAVDYISSRPDVDTARIGALGMSMGSTMSWWTAALDERIKVCVDICCLTDFHALIESGRLDSHGIYYYVPSLLKHFTTGEINALISPRPHLSLAGNYDGLTPVAGLDRLNKELTRIYREDGAPDAWQMKRYATGHLETASMRTETLEFLQTWLGKAKKTKRV